MRVFILCLTLAILFGTALSVQHPTIDVHIPTVPTPVRDPECNPHRPESSKLCDQKCQKQKKPNGICKQQKDEHGWYWKCLCNQPGK